MSSSTRVSWMFSWREALEDSSAVLIHGPRQCGKTTLAQIVCAPEYLAWGTQPTGERPRATQPTGAQPPTGRGHAYITFDDDTARDAARADPAGFVADLPERVVIDEVQRIPELFTAIKTEIDRRREPGRFVLTGSTKLGFTRFLEGWFMFGGCVRSVWGWSCCWCCVGVFLLYQVWTCVAMSRRA